MTKSFEVISFLFYKLIPTPSGSYEYYMNKSIIMTILRHTVSAVFVYVLIRKAWQYFYTQIHIESW